MAEEDAFLQRYLADPRRRALWEGTDARALYRDISSLRPDWSWKRLDLVLARSPGWVGADFAARRAVYDEFGLQSKQKSEWE